MPEKLVAAVRRVAHAREIVERQRSRVEKLKADALPTESAEHLLETFIKNLQLFEEHERALREDLQNRKPDL
jgi:hypothetical protein